MKITSLSALNLKRQRFTHALKPFTIIRGPNWAGKTSRIDALHLALTGRHPRLPKTNDGVFRLASGGIMQVMAVMDETQEIIRTWEVGKGDKITATAKLNGQKFAGEFVPIMALDPSEYLAKSENDRIRMVFSSVKLDEQAISGPGLIAAMKGIKLDDHTEHAEQVINDICEEIEGADRARAESGHTVQEFLAQVISDIDERFASANAAAKRFTGTTQTLDEQRAGQLVADVSAELTKARQQVTKATVEAQRVRDQHGEVINRQTRKLSLETSIAAHLKGEEEHMQKSGELERLRNIVAKYTPKIPQLEAQRTGVQNQRQQAEATVDQLTEESSRIEADLIKVLAKCECPTCREPGDDWKKRYEKAERKTIADNDARVAALAKEIGRFDEWIKRYNTEIEQAKAGDREHALNQQTIERLQRRVAELEPQVKLLNSYRTQLEGIGELPDMTAIDKEIAASDLATKQANDLVAQLEEKQKGWTQAQAAKAAKANAKIAGEKTTAEIAVCKKAKDILLEKQSELVTGAFEQLLKVANTIAEPILGARLAYRKNRFGLDRNGSMAEPGTMSGAEERVALSALCIAIGMQSPMKLVIIDELGTMDTDTKHQVAKTIRLALASGSIDQFIGVDASDFDWTKAATSAGVRKEDLFIHTLDR